MKRREEAVLDSLLGLTVGEAMNRLGINPERCLVFDEPPTVAAGVFCGNTTMGPLSLWVMLRQDGKQERSATAPQELRDRVVLGVLAGYRLSRWVPGGRFSQAGQGVAPPPSPAATSSTPAPRVRPRAAAPARLAEADLDLLIGLTIGEATEWLGIDLARCTVFEEPPMLARGVIGSRAGGESLWLWVAYREGIFRERPDWKPEELRRLRVVGTELYATIERWCVAE